MTILANRPEATPRLNFAPTKVKPKNQNLGKVVVSWLTSTDHKVIGYLYLIASFAFFMVAGLMAMIIRAELARPGLQIVSN